MTKKEYLQAIYDLIVNLGDNSYDDYLSFLSKEIENLNNKAARAKAKAQANRADSDALSDAIADIVPDDYTVIADIVALLNNPEATIGKVTYRLNALVADGVLDKTTLLVGKKKVVAYKHC